MNGAHPTRRRFLRGLGVTLALPWLETPRLRAGDEPVRDSARAGAAPRRFACLFMANGVNPKDWGATGEGKDFVLNDSLKPLEPVKDDLLVLDGLYNPNASVGNIHIGAAPNVLSGALVHKSMEELRVATSFDQVLAGRFGAETEFPSLVLGIEPPYLGIHKGYSCIYCSHISWSSPTTPIPRENDPRALFDRLVGDPRGRRQAASVLDLVLEDAKAVLPRLSSWDRQRFGDYLSSIREVEQRLARVPQQPSEKRHNVRERVAPPDPTPPAAVGDHMRAMLDLLAVAFATDATRVGTLMFNNDLSKMDFGFLRSGSTALTNMHTMSHAGGEDYSLMNRFHVGLYAGFLEKLKTFTEGGESVLDNSCVMFCSSLMAGYSHDRTRMPVLLAGKLGGRLETGRAISHPTGGANDDRRRLCNLYSRLLEDYGVEGAGFGDSVEPLRTL